MTALAPNQPRIWYDEETGLWFAYRDGYFATGDDKEEAAEIWKAIYETTTFQIPVKGLNLDKFLDRVYGQRRLLRFGT